MTGRGEPGGEAGSGLFDNVFKKAPKYSANGSMHFGGGFTPINDDDDEDED
jgi:hypothetical protein